MFLCAFIYHFVTYWTISAVFYILDCAAYRFKWISSFKLNTVRKSLYFEYSLEGATQSLKNQLRITLPMLYLFSDRLYSTELQVFSCLQFFLYIILNDAYFYVMHRLLHCNRIFYVLFHQHHHREKFTAACSALDSGIVEHLFVNIGSVAIGPLLFNGSEVTVLTWFILATINSCFAHSGYKYMSDNHNIHHKNPIYNYGTGLMLFDSLFNTKHTLILLA